MKKEIGLKYMVFGLFLQLGVAYIISLVVYWIGVLIIISKPSAWIVALIAVGFILIVALIFGVRRVIKSGCGICGECNRICAKRNRK